MSLFLSYPRSGYRKISYKGMNRGSDNPFGRTMRIAISKKKKLATTKPIEIDNVAHQL
jgi:hypothetical protein